MVQKGIFVHQTNLKGLFNMCIVLPFSSQWQNIFGKIVLSERG